MTDMYTILHLLRILRVCVCGGGLRPVRFYQTLRRQVSRNFEVTVINFLEKTCWSLDLKDCCRTNQTAFIWKFGTYSIVSVFRTAKLQRGTLILIASNKQRWQTLIHILHRLLYSFRLPNSFTRIVQTGPITEDICLTNSAVELNQNKNAIAKQDFWPNNKHNLTRTRMIALI